MIIFLLLINFLLFFVLLTAGTLLTVFRKEIEIRRRLDVLFGHNGPKKTGDNQAQVRNSDNLLNRVIQPYFRYIRKKVLEKMSKGSMKELNIRLRNAGRPFGLTAIDFRVAQISIALFVFISCGMFIYLFTLNYSSAFLLGLAIGGISFILPSFYLDSLKKKRINLIDRNMADFFDMVTLSIEAGMGLEQAITNVSRQIRGPLSEEFIITLEDIKLGKSRREAFTNLRGRVPSDHFQSILTSIIQAGELGIGMGNLMSTLTQRIREHQREKIREKAMKIPVKILFPMIFFIFPSLFTVILGPFAVNVLVNGLF